MRFPANVSPGPFSRRHTSRSALTVIEILIAATLSLVMILSMVQIFETAGGAIQKARASLALSARMRLAAMRLNIDLDNVTAPLRPRLNPRDGLGYFEYIEGPSRDNDSDANNDPDTTQDLDSSGTPDIDEGPLDGSAGDIDDVIMFTIKSIGEPFVGRVETTINGGGVIESNLAEIVWFTEYDDDNGNGAWDFGEEINIYRRVLLIRPDLDASLSTAGTLTTFFQRNDLSVSNFTGSYVANSLSDLTKRENRFAHANTFPHELDRTTLASYILTGTNTGQDVMVSNVLAFDVRAYDPEAPVVSDGNVALIPGDPEYASYPSPASEIGRGAFVDLQYAPALSPASFFSAVPNNVSNATNNTTMAVPAYCTWSTHYESNGDNEDGDAFIDELINGLDDDSIDGVDDPNEHETFPPYSASLRGIQITMRTVEIDTKQVRQSSVVSNFVPE